MSDSSSDPFYCEDMRCSAKRHWKIMARSAGLPSELAETLWERAFFVGETYGSIEFMKWTVENGTNDAIMTFQMLHEAHLAVANGRKQ